MKPILSCVFLLSCQFLSVQSQCNGIDAKLCSCEVLHEVPRWLGREDSAISSTTGLVADNCSSMVIHERLPSEVMNNFRVWFVKAKSLDQYLTINGSSFNGTSKNHLKDFHWRLAKIGHVTFRTGAFENVVLNLHIYDVLNLTIEERAFVKCRGSVSLHNVTAYIAREAAVSSSLTFIRAGIPQNTVLNILPSPADFEQNKSSLVLNETSLAYNQFVDDSPISSKLLLNATLIGEVALLVVVCVLLILAIVIIRTMGKLYRHNYECLGAESSSRDMQRPNENAPRLPIRPPPRAPFPGGVNHRRL